MGNCVSFSRKEAKQSKDEPLACKYCGGVKSSGTCTCARIGSCSCPPNAAPLPSCVFYSPRIEGLLKGHRTEEETAQDHYTAVDPMSEAEAARVGEENRKYFDEVLVNHPEWGAFFSRFGDLKILDEKIGEGGQAEIFNATSESAPYRYDALVAKVWKAGVSLKDLERQWPPQIFSKGVSYKLGDWPFRSIKGAAFIRGGKFRNRFAFVMERRWSDLRTGIDRRMLEMLRDNSHGPPFKHIQDVYFLMREVCNDLRLMHAAGVLHRDIKASNVLLDHPNSDYDSASYVIDFECSLGVTGTGFWRAPEILEQLRKRVPGHEVVFTEKADIYSFGMMCYEIITGCIPFEGHPQYDYSIVLSGERPELPHDLAPGLKKLVHDCWQHDPELRPTTRDIHRAFYKLWVDLGLNVGRFFSEQRLSDSD